MATLTKSTGTVTLTGSAEKVTLPAAYGWVWLKNMSDADMFAGLSADISEGADGVMTIPAGECGRIQTDGFNSIYLMGTGNALVVAQNYADCPFKAVRKGGESPDLSEYAKKTDIPTELPANGGSADYATNAGNANTVDGLHADDFVNATDYSQIQIPNNVDVPAWIYANGKRYQRYMTNGDNIGLINVPNNSIVHVWYWYDGLNILAREHSSGKYYICDMINGIFSGWKDVYTSGYKPYISGSATVAANSTTCTSNHGFIPSAVIWWGGNDSGVATWFNETQFAIKITSSVDRTINYLIFK